jgi:Arc/MetJ-type ribon-helix-helix transcriptional regulator
MYFESEYRRQAMEKWQSSRAETEKEIIDDLRKSQEHIASAFEQIRSRLSSFLPFSGRSHNRYE